MKLANLQNSWKFNKPAWTGWSNQPIAKQSSLALFNSKGSLIMQKRFACRSFFFKVFYNNLCSVCPWRFIDRLNLKAGWQSKWFLNFVGTVWFHFLKSLLLHCGYNQPGYLLSLNKPPASSAYLSSMEKPVGAVWLSWIFLEERETIQAPASDDSL